MKKTLMVVDDDASVRAALKKVLAFAGHDVTVAASSEDAQRQLDARKVDLLILDIGFGTERCWDAYEELTTAHPSLPVIVITSQSGHYDIDLANGAGALMEKPVDVAHLLTTVQQLLAEPAESRLRRQCSYEPDVQPEPPASTQLLRQLREQQSHDYPALAHAGGKRWGHDYGD